MVYSCVFKGKGGILLCVLGGKVVYSCVFKGKGGILLFV